MNLVPLHRHTMIIDRGIVLCLLLMFPAVEARAQAKAAPWALFTARYDTRTSDFIYALYGYGSTFGMVGALHNPRTDWSEVLGAVGRIFTDAAGNSHTVATGVAQTARLWYGQVYYAPSVRVGFANVRATAELDYPISRGGVTQFALSPISGTIRSVGSVELGLAMDLSAARGDRPAVAIGPELRLPLPRATLGVDAERMTNGTGDRVRVFFMTQL